MTLRTSILALALTAVLLGVAAPASAQVTVTPGGITIGSNGATVTVPSTGGGAIVSYPGMGSWNYSNGTISPAFGNTWYGNGFYGNSPYATNWYGNNWAGNYASGSPYYTSGYTPYYSSGYGTMPYGSWNGDWANTSSSYYSPYTSSGWSYSYPVSGYTYGNYYTTGRGMLGRTFRR